MKSEIYVGTSGYAYEHWANNVFYPKGLKQKDWFEFYSKYLDSVELNVTFYRLPNVDVFKNWYKKTPKNFRFAIKGSRFITHIKRLKDPEKTIKLFLSRVNCLNEKLSVILWQLPPNFKLNIERLKNFIETLKKNNICRQVFEFRHKSWFCNETYDIFKKYNVTICMADWPCKLLCSKNLIDTADFIYIRRHGTKGQLYNGCYSLRQLKKDKTLILKKNKPAYIFFNNDTDGWAIKNAIDLNKIITKV